MAKYISKNKPNLKHKPHWANYWAQDEDGTCDWYENMPHCIECDKGQGVWIPVDGRTQSASKMPIDAMGWAYSLVKIDGETLTVMRTI